MYGEHAAGDVQVRAIVLLEELLEGVDLQRGGHEDQLQGAVALLDEVPQEDQREIAQHVALVNLGRNANKGRAKYRKLEFYLSGSSSVQKNTQPCLMTKRRIITTKTSAA